MRSLLLFAFLSFSIIQINAQTQCETEFTLEDKRQFDQLVKDSGYDFSKNPVDTIDIPIAFYIETYGGTPVYDANNLNTVINQINGYYEPAKLRFFRCGPAYYYENGTSFETLNHVIKVYIATSYNGCGVYTGASNITIDPSCNRPFNEILAHEVGHALGLPHTHGYTNNGTTTELVDGSNCASAGDLFCDTPADPNLLYDVNSSCIYVGTRTDANGELYNPNTHNIMSYTRGGCMNFFSGEQFARVRSVAESKNYYCCITPEPEVNDISICSGISTTITATIISGEIRWYDAPGGNLIHTGTSFTTPVLNATKSYFLKGYEGCESDPVKVTVNVLPAGGVISNITEQLTQFGNDSSSSSIYDVIDADSLLYFNINFAELWSFAGEPGSEQLLFSVGAGGDGGNSASISSIAAGSNKILMGVNDQNNGPSLWVSDGTAGGNELLKEWGGTDYRYSNFWITEFNGSFIFELTRLPDENAEIWISDGSVAGTQMVVSLPNTSSFSINRFYNYNGHLYFKAASTLNDLEPWVTDGTAAGTHMLKEINANGSANPENFTEHNGLFYFSADDGINGRELWKTDGTEENTIRVTDINPDGSTSFTNFKSIDNFLYFSANNSVNGAEPYFTDGTVSGTVLMEDINPSFGSNPGAFTKCNGAVFFLASSIEGEISDLYEYQPDNQTLTQVKHFSVNGFNSSEMVCYNEMLYFSSANETNNFEPWISDGTESGTVQWLDLNPTGSSSPRNFTIFNGEIIFSARISNEELYHTSEENYKVCNGNAVTITTQNHSGTVSWYDAMTGGNLLDTGYVFQSDALIDSISFWADLTIDGCTSERTEIPVAVTTIELNASITHETNPSDGAIDLSVSGGLPPYQFDWSTDGSGDFDDEEDLSGLVPGTYEVTVIDSSGCIATASYEVFSIPKLFVSSIINVNCFGDSTGAIGTTIAGGTAPFDYLWSNGAVTPDISDLVAETYTLVVTDSNGFSATVDVEIVQPNELLATSAQTQMISCFGENNGAFEISAQGGTEPYEYAINGGNFGTENIFSNLNAAEYNFEVADANGCSFTDSLEISQPDELEINNLTITHNPCPGQTQGSIDFEANGGTEPYNYQLDGLSVELPVVGLATGNYALDVLDANGCTASVTVMIEESAGVVFNADIVAEPLCYGEANGIVSVNVVNGIMPYKWSTDGGISFTDFPPNSSATSLLNLPAGLLEIIVQDSNGCQMVQSTTLSEPEELTTIENDIQSISCFGESDAIVEVVAFGGTPPFEYAINGEGFEINNIFGNLGAGNHTYSVLDANACLYVGDFVLTEPEVLEHSLTITDQIGEELGSIDLSVSGGTPPYSYDWDNDGTGDYDDPEDLENLTAGTYTVNVLDINNCGFSASAEVEFFVGINEAGVLSEIHIFPNPTAGNLIVDFGNSLNSQTKIRIYDALGELIYQKNDYSEDRLEIDLSNEESGIYLLKIFAGDDLLVKQIIKQ